VRGRDDPVPERERAYREWIRQSRHL
jgi:hypothetical protein